MKLQHLRKLLPGYYRKRERQKFVKYLDDYLGAKAQLSPRTLRNYEYYLTRFSRDNPDWPVTTEAIIKYLLACSNEQGLSPASVRSSYNCLRAFFSWCMETERITKNPMIGVKAPKQPPPASRSADKKALEKFFAHLELSAQRAVEDGVNFKNFNDVRDLALFSLMYDTGTRLRETSHVMVKDVDLDRDLVRITEAKGGKPRDVAIGKNTRGDLRLLIRAREQMGVPTTCPYLFVKRRIGWKRLEEQGIRKRLIDLCRELEIPYFKPHQIRHSYALQSIRNGGNLADVSRQLGHSSVSITDHYVVAPEVDRVPAHRVSSPRDH